MTFHRTTASNYVSPLLTKGSNWPKPKPWADGKGPDKTRNDKKKWQTNRGEEKFKSGADSAMSMQPDVQRMTLSNKQVEEAQYIMKMNINKSTD